MRVDVLTLFPEMFPGYLGQSLLKLAIERKLVEVRLHDIREWAVGRHRSVDDRPFGGGPGMLLMAPPVVECVEAVQAQAPPGHVVLLTPQGQRLTQSLVEELASQPRLVLLCGRYEGFDERVKEILEPRAVSVGDYVLNGGEVAAMVLIDAVIRLIPGVLGDERSAQEESFSAEQGFSAGQRHLEHAQYTRPRSYRGHDVPPVLLSGDHQAIAAWRTEQSRLRTASLGNATARVNASPDGSQISGSLISGSQITDGQTRAG